MEVDKFEEDELGNFSMDKVTHNFQVNLSSAKKDMNSIASLLFTVFLVINGCSKILLRGRHT
eukprot:4964916-Ditylum_brightwellii.AAC.1